MSNYYGSNWSDPRNGVSAEELMRSFASSTGTSHGYQSYAQNYIPQYQFRQTTIYTLDDLMRMQKSLEGMMGTVKVVRKDSRMRCLDGK